MAPRFEWTVKKDTLLIKKYFMVTIDELAILLGTNRQAVIRRARHLNIPKKSQIPHLNKQYSETEIAFIVSNINKLSTAEVAEHLNRTEEAIRVFCKRRNIKINANSTWNRKQLQCLLENSQKLSIEELSQILDKTPQAIRKYANDLKIPLKKSSEVKPIRKWTQEEREYLLNNLHLKHHEIAKHIGRTAEAVARYASANGFLKLA